MGKFVAALAAVFVFTATLGFSPEQEAKAGNQPPNFVVIYTDDQKADTLQYMPNTLALLGEQGVTFQNGFVTNPVCCPSRASLFTGTYSHTNLVWGNNPPLGGWDLFDSSSTWFTWLDDVGYRTGLFGKVMNHYGDSGEAIPVPGVDRMFGFLKSGYPGGKWSVNDNGTVTEGTEYETAQNPNAYSTQVLSDKAGAFIGDSSSSPFFAYIAPYAPHNPTTPHPDDEGDFQEFPFPSLQTVGGQSFNEGDVSDKPQWVQNLPRFTVEEKEEIRQKRIDQVESLQAVDRLVADVVQQLTLADRLENTMIVFMSDNGYQWGEHRLFGKNVAYDDSVRVPLIVRADFLGTTPRIEDAIGLNIDLAVTLAALAGADTSPVVVDGRDLTGVLLDTEEGRARFLVEHPNGGASPAFCSARNRTAMYVKYTTGEEEFYDYTVDPFETENAESENSDTMVTLRNFAKNNCDPRPPGFIWQADRRR